MHIAILKSLTLPQPLPVSLQGGVPTPEWIGGRWGGSLCCLKYNIQINQKPDQVLIWRDGQINHNYFDKKS